MKRKTGGRIPTTAGAVILTVAGLFVGILVAQIVVKELSIEGAGALLLELVILGTVTGAVWVALPERFSTPWDGFFSGNEVEPWIPPEDRDDGRWEPDDPRHERSQSERTAAGDDRDPRGDDGPTPR